MPKVKLENRIDAEVFERLKARERAGKVSTSDILADALDALDSQESEKQALTLRMENLEQSIINLVLTLKDLTKMQPDIFRARQFSAATWNGLDFLLTNFSTEKLSNWPANKSKILEGVGLGGKS